MPKVLNEPKEDTKRPKRTTATSLMVGQGQVSTEQILHELAKKITPEDMRTLEMMTRIAPTNSGLNEDWTFARQRALARFLSSRKVGFPQIIDGIVEDRLLLRISEAGQGRNDAISIANATMANPVYAPQSWLDKMRGRLGI